MAPIHTACRFGSTQSIKAIFYWTKRDQDRLAIQLQALEDGRLPIHVACQHGHLPAVTALLEEMKEPSRAAPIVHARNARNQLTPLHYACASGRVEIARYLVETHDARIDAREGPSQPNVPTAPPTHLTPLDLATKNGHVEAVQFLLGKGSIVTARTLHLAADEGPKMLRVLVKSLPKRCSAILGSVVDQVSLLDYDWLLESVMMTNRCTSFAEVCHDHRHWRAWNLLALILHRYYFSSSSVNVPPLFQLSNQVDAKVTIRRRISRPTASPLQSNQASLDLANDEVAESSPTGVQDATAPRSEHPQPQHVLHDDNEYEEVHEIVEFENSNEKDFSWMLHAATCLRSCPPSVISFLARMFPSQLITKHRGLTPMLIASRSPFNTSSTIAVLLACDPRAAAIRENTVRGFLPLAAALARSKPPEVLAKVISAYPPALLELGPNSLRVGACYAPLDSFYWFLRSSPDMALDILKRL